MNGTVLFLVCTILMRFFGYVLHLLVVLLIFILKDSVRPASHLTFFGRVQFLLLGFVPQSTYLVSENVDVVGVAELIWV